MLKCGIYKAQNKINGQIYIGQSNDITNRWTDHKNEYKNGTSKFYQAIRKFGWDNFEWSILEECSESELDEKELYYIIKYNTVKNGYNSVYGAPFQRNSFRKISEEEYKNLLRDLIDNKLSFEELSDKYKLSISYIYEINRGDNGKRDDNLYSYPLRKVNINHINKNNVENIKKDLKENILSFDEIKEKYNIGNDSIYRINTGLRYYDDKEDYPLNKNAIFLLSKEEINLIYKDLKENKLSIQEIANKYNRVSDTILKINRGETYKQENIKYPIRKFNRHILSEKEVEEIYDLILNSSLSFKEIGERYNNSYNCIYYINNGISHKKEGFSYPLRK